MITTVHPQFLFTTSWDDGSPHDLRLADVLGKYGLPATFYIPRRSQRPVMSENSIQNLASAFDVGAHTLNHVVLTRISNEAARAEILGSRRWLQDLTGRACNMFCFPSGHFRTEHLAYVKEAEFIGTRTVELMSIQFPKRSNGTILVPTTVQVCPHRISVYFRNFAKRAALQNFVIFARYAHTSDWVAAARSLLTIAVQKGGVFHVWGHSWEVEEYGLWSRLEPLFGFVRNLVPPAAFVTNSELCARFANA